MLLAEELLLLVMDDKTGKISVSSAGTINLGFAGAMLMDLGFRESIICNEKILRTNKNAIIDDPILEKIFNEIKKKENLDISYWIKYISNNYNSYRIEIIKRFEEEGIIDRLIVKELKIFRRVLHPLLIPEVKLNLKKAIQAVILGNDQPDERIIGLLALIKSCNLIKSIFQKEHWGEISGKINDLIKSEHVNEKLRKFLHESHQAMIASMYNRD